MRPPTLTFLERISVLFLASLGASGFSQENGQLEATLLSGPLAIDPSSVSELFTPTNGRVVSTNAEQADAMHFLLEGIRIYDLNDDGLAFSLTAVPTTLVNPGNGNQSRREMTIGTTPGFVNPSDPTNAVLNGNTLQYGLADAGLFEIDYEIYYNVPKFAELGNFSGSVAFSVVAE